MGPIRPNTAWLGPTNGPTARPTRETTSVHAAPGTVVIAASDTGRRLVEATRAHGRDHRRVVTVEQGGHASDRGDSVG